MSTYTVRSLEMRRQIRGLTPSRRPAHAVVAVDSGDIEGSLKRLKKMLVMTGVHRLIAATHGGKLGGYVGPSEKRRLKSRAARSRARKQVKRRELAQARTPMWEGQG